MSLSVGVSWSRATSGSSLPKDSASAPSAADAEASPRSDATADPRLTVSIPRPTSARNSRRVLGTMTVSWEGGRRNNRLSSPNARALHDFLRPTAAGDNDIRHGQPEQRPGDDPDQHERLAQAGPGAGGVAVQRADDLHHPADVAHL